MPGRARVFEIPEEFDYIMAPPRRKAAHSWRCSTTLKGYREALAEKEREAERASVELGGLEEPC